MLPLNSKAPTFKLKDQNGNIHSLEDYLGEYVLIYFYPKDDTPGCTKEACNLRDNLTDFKKLKCKVIGISSDDVESHSKFSAKNNLSFPILADENKEVVKKYEALVEKSMFGKKFTGIKRCSYLVNPKGVIVKVYDKVRPTKHAIEVLLDLENINKVINSL